MRSLQRRLASLRNLELFNAFFLPLIFLQLWSDARAQTFGARGVGMALVSFLLMQGSVYWHLKLRSIRARAPIAKGYLHIFRSLKRINVIALTLATLGIPTMGLLGLVTSQDALWGFVLTGFSWLEFINYYHVQLAHDTRHDLTYLRRWKRLRPAPLSTDLRQEKF